MNHFCVLLAWIILFHSLGQAEETFDQLRHDYASLESELTQKWVSHKTVRDENWLSYKEQVRKQWSDEILPSAKTYVEYWDGNKSRVKIDYERGIVTLQSISEEPLSNKTQIEQIQGALEKSIDLVENQLSDRNGRILTQDSLPNFTKELEKQLKPTTKITGSDGINRHLYSIEIPMVPDHIKRRAKQYLPFVKFWSNKYSIPEGLILAIMWQESAFNPLARSYIPAYGLMQIVPRFAGAEVKSMLGDSSIIDGPFLYNPENNIRYGVSFLHLLSSKSFSKIKSFDKRVPFIIAGYNWGPNRLLTLLKKGKLKLTSPRAIKDQIYKVAPAETKDYLIRVIDHWKQIENETWLAQI